MKPWYTKAREILDAKGISIRELSDTLGMTPGGAGHYLSGRRHPRPGMLKKIAAKLEVSVSELVEDDPSFARNQDEHDALEAFRGIAPANLPAALAMLRGLQRQATTASEPEPLHPDVADAA